LRRHHDAAARRLPDLRADQAEPDPQINPGDHALEQRRRIRSCARQARRIRPLSHQALHQGSLARGGEGTRQGLTRERFNVMPIKNILVVDDSPTDRQHLTDILAKGGYNVSTAASAEEGISKAKL